MARNSKVHICQNMLVKMKIIELFNGWLFFVKRKKNPAFIDIPVLYMKDKIEELTGILICTR